jgi:uncharacterized Zn finger protein (UPF0148 family)
MWQKIKSWFTKKPKSNIDMYVDMLDKCKAPDVQVSTPKLAICMCPICNHKVVTEKLEQHIMSVHGMSQEEAQILKQNT